MKAKKNDEIVQRLMSASPDALRDLKLRVDWVALLVQIATALISAVAGGVRQVAQEPYHDRDNEAARRLLGDLPRKAKRRSARKLTGIAGTLPADGTFTEVPRASRRRGLPKTEEVAQ